MRKFLFRCEKLIYRDGIDLSQRNKNKNQNQESEIIFFTQLLNKSSYFAFLVEKDILRNTWNKHKFSSLYVKIL